MLRTLTLTLLLASPLLAPPMASADTLGDQTWAVSGTISLVGYDVCSPSPCAETINFSFDLYYLSAYTPGIFGYEAHESNLMAIGSGSLGAFTYSFPGGGTAGDASGNYPVCSGGDSNYIGFFDPGHDEIDVHLCDSFADQPVAPSLTWADLYNCATATCQDEFPYGAGSGGGSLTNVTVNPVPEPSTVASLLAGLLAIGIWRRLRICGSV